MLYSFIGDCMCGICFILGGVPAHSHDFAFDFFSAYLANHPIPLSKHILENKLILPPSFEPEKISKRIKQRGPDHLETTHIDLFKVNYEGISIQSLDDNHFAGKDEAFGFQSILHLRGKHYFTPDIPGCYFLFNG